MASIQMADIKGVLAPVFTPVDDDGLLNTRVIPEYARFLNKHGIKGILVGGTTGEAVTLTLDERKDVLQTWIKEAQQFNIKVIAQVGGVPFPEVLAMTMYAEMTGANCIMTLPELFFKPKTCEQLVSYLELVAQAAPSLPLLYYHFPQMTGVDLNMKDLFDMATSKIPNFKGIKADFEVAKEFANLADDQRIFIANHHLLLPTVYGLDSSIATVTNIFPDVVQDLVKLMKAGDDLRSAALQRKLDELVSGITAQGDFVPTMKAAMQLVTGIKVGPPRLPQIPLSDTSVARIADHLKNCGLSLAVSEE
ncbi:N-acetylneuraminate lyase-like [Galleria mellonella]|uniref:N-acetylneuraminate lyase n=1 Tax=Galleria mellonella TaxID=7137 RepID=A0A6J3CEJ0_GALME|nr:N-acetylneuraminate lyase-like [Galleria mellonella]